MHLPSPGIKKNFANFGSLGSFVACHCAVHYICQISIQDLFFKVDKISIKTRTILYTRSSHIKAIELKYIPIRLDKKKTFIIKGIKYYLFHIFGTVRKIVLQILDLILKWLLKDLSQSYLKL